MKNIIYSKFNSHRAPEYRLRTSFVEEGTRRYVEKTPLCDEAKEHIENMLKNSEKLKNTYKSIIPVSCIKTENGIKFPYVKGEALDKDIDYAKDSIEDICKKIKKILGIIFNFNEGVVKGGMVSPANIDSIISNFVRSEGRIYLLDYEWVDADEVPLLFLEFRAILYTYKEHINELGDRIEVDDFIKLFGINQRRLGMLYGMEDQFQCMVHGRKCKYIYTTGYEKEITDFEEFNAKNIQEVERLSREVKEKDFDIYCLHGIVGDKDRIISNYAYSIGKAASEIDKYRRRPRLNPIKIRRFNKEEEALVAKSIQDMEAVEANKDLLGEMRKDLLGEYDYWIRTQEAKDTYDSVFEYRPLISVCVPVYNVEEKMLMECIDSVREQIYEGWELILVDDGSTLDTVRPNLVEAEKLDDRIHVYFREENGGISKATNDALSHAKGEFIALLDCDDILSKNALYENVALLNKDRSLDVIYSDEDKIYEKDGERSEPNFKPDYSPDTLLSVMYTCHLTLYRKSIVDKVGGFNSKYDGAQDYDLILRVSEETDKIAHIPKILYHWRMREGSTADDMGAKPEIVEATVNLKKDALKRRGLMGHVEMIPNLYLSRVVYDIKDRPLVSIVIPSKDHPTVLENCISTLVRFTQYRDYEIIVIDNGSNDENRAYYEYTCARHGADYYYEPMEFNFSRMCNIGASYAKGEYILFLNDDMEIIDKYWLTRMLGTAQLDHVGAVGAKLYYPDKVSLQHIGVVNGKVGPGHLLVYKRDDIILDYHRNVLDFDVIAVTGAALLLRKDKFNEIGGFDETFAVNYNDVDLCFKLLEHGYYNVVRTDAKLIHHESLSRGMGLLDKDRLFAERTLLYSVHPDFDGKDPFYNVNMNQYMPSFGIDQDRDSVFTCEEAGEDIIEGDVSEIEFNIDRVAVNWDLGIFGWFLHKTNNDYNPVKIYLERKEDGKAFVLSTRGMIMDYVKEKYGDVPYSDFSGFRTMTDRRIVEDGTYKLYLLKDKVKYNTGKIIFVGTKNPDSDSIMIDADSE